jgi:hypothetical protein
MDISSYLSGKYNLSEENEPVGDTRCGRPEAIQPVGNSDAPRTQNSFPFSPPLTVNLLVNFLQTLKTVQNAYHQVAGVHKPMTTIGGEKNPEWKVTSGDGFGRNGGYRHFNSLSRLGVRLIPISTISYVDR